MVSKSEKNNRNVNHSGNYEVDGLIFPSRFVFSTIASIERNLKFLYTEGSEDTDYFPIFHSPDRENDKNFAAILKRVEVLIKRITGIDDTKHFIFKEKHRSAFLKKFEAINYCILEGMYLHSKYRNKFEKKIIDIVRSLCHIGLDPYSAEVL